MNEQLTTHKAQNSALAVMASRFAVEPLKLLSTLKSTVFKGASDDELLALVVVANEYGLNPLTKEIYAFPAKGGGIVPVISIDGWVNRMNSNDKFDGIEFEDDIGEDGKPIKVTATIWRKDRSKPIKVTEYYAECKRNTEPWNTMPCRMLRHKALCQCVRVAFGFGGVYDEDEARDVSIRDVTPLFPASPAALPPGDSKPTGKKRTEKPAEASAPASAPASGEKAPDAPAPASVAGTGNGGGDEEGGLFHVEQEKKPTECDELLQLLEKEGVTEAQALEICKANRIPVGDTLATSPVKTIKLLLKDAKTLVAEAKK